MEPQVLKIPKERIAVLIGKNGQTKKDLEQKTKTQISIDSEEGEITIESKDNTDLNSIKAGEIVKAIGRGFSPEHAFFLLNDDYYFELIDLDDLAGKNQKQIQQKKGRVIGRNGSTRKIIEEETHSMISVYGKTIGIIGKLENLDGAREAIEMLVNGSNHDTVYNFLKNKGVKETKFEL